MPSAYFGYKHFNQVYVHSHVQPHGITDLVYCHGNITKKADLIYEKETKQKDAGQWMNQLLTPCIIIEQLLNL